MLNILKFCFLININRLFFTQNTNLIKNIQIPKSTKKNCQVQYKIEDDKCGEICVSTFAAPHTIRLGGVKPGSCLDVGYTEFQYSEKVWLGPFGTTFIDIYKKP
jgi:hypothetical protein